MVLAKAQKMEKKVSRKDRKKVKKYFSQRRKVMRIKRLLALLSFVFCLFSFLSAQRSSPPRLPFPSSSPRLPSPPRLLHSFLQTIAAMRKHSAGIIGSGMLKNVGFAIDIGAGVEKGGQFEQYLGW